MANRFDIATGKPPPPIDPNKVEVDTTKPQEIAETVIKRLSPKNGDVFFITSDRLSEHDWEEVRHALNSTLKSLHITCGLVFSKFELDVKKEEMGTVARVIINDTTTITEKEIADINKAIMTDNRPQENSVPL